MPTDDRSRDDVLIEFQVLSRQNARRRAKELIPEAVEFLAGSMVPVFTADDLVRALQEQSLHESLQSLGRRQLLALIVRAARLTEVLVTNSRGTAQVRYVLGSATPFQIALSLSKRGFLSHETALSLNRLIDRQPSTIYLNEEQSAKSLPKPNLTQDGIDRAFRGEQRRSEKILTCEGFRIVVLHGKDTRAAGVIEVTGPQDERLRSTSIERTLIDISVRPDYAGGLSQVLGAYSRALPQLRIESLSSLLLSMGYSYPYHQSIGFLLQAAGVPLRDLAPLRLPGLPFDFYLGYDLPDLRYDPYWRIFYPSKLVSEQG